MKRANRTKQFDAARRSFILKAGVGLGALSLAELVATPAAAQTSGGLDAGLGVLGTGHFPARATRVATPWYLRTSSS